MKKLIGTLCTLALIFGSLPTAEAIPYNVAQGASVSLDGNFFTDGWGAGIEVDPASIVDGIFLEEGTQWDQGTLWWDEHNQDQATVFIDLGQDYYIDSFIVQADNNDEYQISYYNNMIQEWIVIGPLVPGWGMMTRPEIVLMDRILTSQLAITAVSGDGYYSLSEIQAFGELVPEPTTMLLFGFGLIALGGFRRKFKK